MTVATTQRILIDASAVIAVINCEPPRAAILAAVFRTRLAGAASLPFEISNALSSSMKRRELSLEQVLSARYLFGQMPIELLPVRHEASLRLAAKHRLYAYDAGVVDAAAYASIRLLTLDRGMRHVARAEGVEIVEV